MSRSERVANGKLPPRAELYFEDPAFPVNFVKSGLEIEFNAYVKSEDYYHLAKQYKKLYQIAKDSLQHTDCQGECESLTCKNKVLADYLEKNFEICIYEE